MSMINVNVPRPAVRLLIDGRLQDQLLEMDEDRYQTFCQAVRFAEDAIAGRTTQEGELPQFLAPYEDLQLVIDFCRVRERFMVRAIIEPDDDTPPPGASAWAPEQTPAESILRAAGIDIQHQGPATTVFGLGAEESVWSGGSLLTGASIRVGDDSGALSVVLALSRLGLSGPFVTLALPDRTDAAHTATPFCAPASSQPAATTPAMALDSDSVPPVPSGAPAPGTSTDP
jgi:hypothetical protein